MQKRGCAQHATTAYSNVLTRATASAPLKLIRSRLQLRYARQSKEADLRRAFDKLDSKCDNKIDAEELMAFFKSVGETFKRVRRANTILNYSSGSRHHEQQPGQRTSTDLEHVRACMCRVYPWPQNGPEIVFHVAGHDSPVNEGHMSRSLAEIKTLVAFGRKCQSNMGFWRSLASSSSRRRAQEEVHQMCVCGGVGGGGGGGLLREAANA